MDPHRQPDYSMPGDDAGAMIPDGADLGQGADLNLPAHCPCPSGSYCDLAANACKPGCATDPDCPMIDICTADHKCVPGCRKDGDCPSTACAKGICDHGTCGSSPVADGTACPGSGAPCTSAKCAAGKCVDHAWDLTSDAKNCGVCGHACPTNSSCQSSACVVSASSQMASDSCDDVCARQGATCATASWCFAYKAGCTCMGLGCGCSGIPCSTKATSYFASCADHFSYLGCTCKVP
jgi:hypothetical protein